MFVMDHYGHKLSNGVLFAHHLTLDAPGGSSHLGYRRRVPLEHNPRIRVNQYGQITYYFNNIIQSMKHEINLLIECTGVLLISLTKPIAASIVDSESAI